MHIYSQIENHHCLAERVPKGAEEIATWISNVRAYSQKIEPNGYRYRVTL